MILQFEITDAIESRIDAADMRYGTFASSHEALGVIMEEFDELREAIRSNDPVRIHDECLDMAAPLIRLAISMRNSKETRNRSKK